MQKKRRINRFFSVFFSLAFLLSGLFVMPASAAGMQIPIFRPDMNYTNAYKLQYKTTNGETVNAACQVTETGGAYRLENTGPISVSIATTTRLTFRCMEDFWNGYNIDPNATYSGFVWLSVEKGASEFILDSSAMTIGNLTFPYTSTDVNPNNKNRNFSYQFSFKGSDLVKKASDGSYFSVYFTLNKTTLKSSYSIWGTLALENFTYTAGTPGVDKVTSFLDKPVAPPPNQGKLDGTVSDYQQKEEALTSTIDSADLTSAISGLNVAGLLDSANVFTDCFNSFWGKLGKLQLVSQFAIVAGVVMMILGVGFSVVSLVRRYSSRGSKEKDDG